MPTTAVLELTRRGPDRAWMRKRAAAEIDVSDIEPVAGTTLLHINALGDYEAYGTNRNGDAFTERGGTFIVPEPKSAAHQRVHIDVGNVQTHPTFVTHGRVYRDHCNRTGDKEYGPILKSAHNDRMKRVELIIRVRDDEFRDDLEKLARGDPLAWSMSTRVPYDVCNICGNRARNRSEYCKHAADHLTEIRDDGRQVCVLNDHMCFFDISRVRRPADRIALTLRKVAENRVCSGAELAEYHGLVLPRRVLENDPKYAAMLQCVRKLADIEKEIPGTDARIIQAAGPAKLTDEERDGLGSISTDLLLYELARRGVCVDPESYLKMQARDDCKCHDNAQHVDSELPNIFGRLLDSGLDVDPGSLFQPRGSLLGRAITPILDSLAERHSLDERPMRRRVTMMVIRCQPASVKTASVTGPVSAAAQEYARYQMFFVSVRPDLARPLIYGNSCHRAP